MVAGTVSNPSNGQLNVLLVMHECNPEWTSVPLLAFQFYRTLKQTANVVLVTHERNRQALSKACPDDDIRYIDESQRTYNYFRYFVEPLMKLSGSRIWQLFTVLAYPVYAEFNQRVYKLMRKPVAAGAFDIVHAITPMVPRYPVKISQVCEQCGVPFVLGPINGGLPYPDGFRRIAAREYAYFSLFRTLGRNLIPDYKGTYRRANHILFGSTYTLKRIKQVLNLDAERISLFFENGINQSFADVQPQRLSPAHTVQLLFVGRLVPYKGADMLLEAMAAAQTRPQLHLTIVGDGAERDRLEKLAQQLGLQAAVSLTGWISQQEILDYYTRADIFCFPSVREFGGAVVMEAMAAGLPCITINYGGVGEYVVDGTGFKVDPRSREHVISQFSAHIDCLVRDPSRRHQMSQCAQSHARQFTWENKAQALTKLYASLQNGQKNGQPPVS
ncbi:MAG: glycosyltransferase family 4 protein [Cyanobacteria bacterium P01_A01_bin.105]